MVAWSYSYWIISKLSDGEESVTLGGRVDFYEKGVTCELCRVEHSKRALWEKAYSFMKLFLGTNDVNVRAYVDSGAKGKFIVPGEFGGSI